jgi:hypothetical protein
MLPLPAEGNVSLPGCVFIQAMSSLSVFACTDGCTLTRCGTAAAIATGEKSLITS